MANLAAAGVGGAFAKAAIVIVQGVCIGTAVAGLVEGGALLGVKHLHDEPGRDPKKALLIKVARYVLLALAVVAAVAITAVTAFAAGGVTFSLLSGTSLSLLAIDLICYGAMGATAAACTYGHYKAFSWALN